MNYITEVKINYVEEFNIQQPNEVVLENKPPFYSRKIFVKTKNGYDIIILNSSNKNIISIEEPRKKTP